MQMNVFYQPRVTRNAESFAAGSVPCLEGFVGSVSLWQCCPSFLMPESGVKWREVAILAGVGCVGAGGGRRNVRELQAVRYFAPHVSTTWSSSMISVSHVSCVAYSAGFLSRQTTQWSCSFEQERHVLTPRLTLPQLPVQP